MFHLAGFLCPREIKCVKQLTREQVEARKEKAVRFVRDVLDDPDRAHEIEDEDVEDYAERRKFQIINPTRRTEYMAKRSKPEDSAVSPLKLECVV